MQVLFDGAAINSDFKAGDWVRERWTGLAGLIDCDCRRHGLGCLNVRFANPGYDKQTRTYYQGTAYMAPEQLEVIDGSGQKLSDNFNLIPKYNNYK